MSETELTREQNPFQALVQELKIRADLLLVEAQKARITDNDSYIEITNLLKQIKEVEQDAKLGLLPTKEEAYRRYGEVLAACQSVTDPIKIAETTLKAEVRRYAQEQEEKKRQAELAALLAAKQAEENRRLDEARALEAMGERDQADAILSEPVIVPPPKLESAIADKNGASIRSNWKGRVTNIRKALESLLKNPGIDLEAVVEFNPSALNALARTYKENLAKVFDGIVAYDDAVVSQRLK